MKSLNYYSYTLFITILIKKLIIKKLKTELKQIAIEAPRIPYLYEKNNNIDIENTNINEILIILRFKLFVIIKNDPNQLEQEKIKNPISKILKINK